MRVRHLLHSATFLILLLAAAAVLIYGRSLNNDFVMWDDDVLVYLNPLTQALTPRALLVAFTSYDPELYVPLTIMSFQLEHALVGFVPFFFHLDNLLLHVVTASLLFLLLENSGLSRLAAFLGALIFTVHPINTEAVAWVSARKDLLAGVFSLAALLAYVRLRSDPRRVYFWLTLAFLLLALLSKPVAIILPLVFLLIDWMDDGRIGRRNWTDKIPFFVLSMLFLAIGLVGKQRTIGAVTLVDTVLLAAKSTLFSIEKYFVPHAYSSVYPLTSPISITSPGFFIPIVILVTASLLVLWSLRKTRRIAFGLGFFLLFLLPSFSNFTKGHEINIFSDRYVYLAQIGFLFLIGYALDRLLAIQRGRRGVIATLWIVLLPLCMGLAWTSSAQSLVWKDSETLFRDTLSKNDSSALMNYNLGLLEHRKGNRAAAFQQYQKALALDPRLAKALGNLGIYYQESGETGMALEQLRLAIESDPNLPEPHNNLGSLLMDQGNIDAAIAEYRKAISLGATSAQVHINLAAALRKKGLHDEAMREYRRAFELAP